MPVMSSLSRQKTWNPGRQRVSVLAEMALRKEHVVERLVALREAHSLTQEQAAQKVGVTHRQWQRWEAGESMPYPRNLDLVASAFGISVEEFFSSEPSRPTTADSLDALRGQLDAIEAAQGEILDRLDQLLANAVESLDDLSATARRLTPAPPAKPQGRPPRG